MHTRNKGAVRENTLCLGIIDTPKQQRFRRLNARHQLQTQVHLNSHRSSDTPKGQSNPLTKEEINVLPSSAERYHFYRIEPQRSRRDRHMATTQLVYDHHRKTHRTNYELPKCGAQMLNNTLYLLKSTLSERPTELHLIQTTNAIPFSLTTLISPQPPNPISWSGIFDAG